MKNKFSLLNERDVIPFYAEIMRNHDLNANAIKAFAWAIRKGNLQEIQEMFRILNENQKKGLINLFIDFSDLGGGYFDSAGFPTELAKKFGYVEIEDFLKDQKKELNRLTNAVTFFKKNKQQLKKGQYQDPLIEILSYLTSDELINIIETISTASEDYETTQEQVLRIITVLSHRNQSKLDIQNLERALCICSDNIIFTEFDVETDIRAKFLTTL